MDCELRPLEITEDSFLALALQRAVYVDKTDLIFDLLKSRGPYFLARPRRFGKSLLLDTIQQIFEGKKELFDGLKIDRKAPNFSWESFPVLRINMNTVSSEPDEFKSDL
ncbi:MAG: AAA family ATPase, partial [Deltaproteobacteria bacterium]|nr:AAA family ATPase [Deltaproteobacteria bacterium]